jgi:hypothetical protein
MRRMMTAVALTLALSAAAEAGCKEEVSTALDRQRKTSGFRMETMMLSEDGKVDMTVDYVLPDRMHQIVKSTKDPEPVETIVVGNTAWSRRKSDPWVVLNPEITSQLVKQMQETLGDDPGQLGSFDCLGKQPVGGKDALAYQGENDSEGEDDGPKDVSPAAKDKPKLPDRPVRVIYVDPTTGLPLRSVFGRANRLDKPIFESTYSYPVDLKIESPLPKK